jgi:replication fork protection complex subunit Tof1/Swi1
VLGDDAAAVLRDLKRWLKLYDEKANRLDVARCLAESNLVEGDLLQILATWRENEIDNKHKMRIALGCLELLVPLTWPLDKGREMTVNHHRHVPFLQLAQVGYKRSIINFDGARILHTATRVALPSMAVPIKDRSSRDENIIKLLLYFVRNIAMITPPPGVEYDGDEAEISRSATIDAFQYQDILHLLLVLSSSMGEDFNTQDIVVMEIIFHLVKGINTETLFMSEKQVDAQQADELANLRNQEAGMQRGYARSAPTRHNRFGTMIWIKRDDQKMSTVSGQDALVSGAKVLDKMDRYKKWKPPKRASKGETGSMDFDTPVSLSHRANTTLKKFVEDFLDSGFNPLFQNTRKAIEREAERILDYHHRQFFYLVNWFLEAERMRRAAQKSKKSKSKSADKTTDDSFSLVASVLNQEMFITLNRSMEANYTDKMWEDLKANMRCFTQILLTVQEMFESPLEEDQEIAENILARIFYEETTHDRVANIVRTYKDQGFGYLDAATELAHTYIRILEAYSKQNRDLQVRSLRRTRKKKKQPKATGEQGAESDDDLEVVGESGDDEARAERTSKERNFDFKRFASRFLAQGCIDTFTKFTSYYADLSPAQLKRSHRFFYRIAFKMEWGVMLFRVDIIHLLHKMIRGPDGLDPANKGFKEWEELVRQILRKCVKKVQERPELVVEMLFSKTTHTSNFLQYGYETQTIRNAGRPAAELVVKPGHDEGKHVAVVVGALLDRNEGHLLEWVKEQLQKLWEERVSWEDANMAIASIEATTASEEAGEDGEPVPAPAAEPPRAPTITLKPNNDTCKTALFKNGYLRLLLKLCGFTGVDDPDTHSSMWLVPPEVSATSVQDSLDKIKAAEFDPPTFENGLSAEGQIKRVSAAGATRKRVAYDDDDDDDDLIDDDEILFPAGGPTARNPTNALAALKRTRRKRRKVTPTSGDEGEIDESVLAERARLRREKELEKMRKVKSELFVHDSDDDSDAERDKAFFAEEERRRQKVGRVIASISKLAEVTGPKGRGRKRAPVIVDEESEDEETKRARRIQNLLDENEMEMSDSPEASPPKSSARAKRRTAVEDSETEEDEAPARSRDVDMSGMNDSEKENSTSRTNGKMVALDSDDEDAPIVSQRARNRTVGAFVDDSDDE